MNGSSVASGSDGGSSLNTVTTATTVAGPGGAGAYWSKWSGGLDEVAVYGSALSQTQITNHWLAAGYVPAAPTNVSATAGSDQATVSWSPPAYAGTSAITNYLVTPYIGTTALPPTSALTANSVVVNNLGGGSAYTFTVTAVNDSGQGTASAASLSVTILGATPYKSSILSDTPTAYWRLDETSQFWSRTTIRCLCAAIEATLFSFRKMAEQMAPLSGFNFQRGKLRFCLSKEWY